MQVTKDGIQYEAVQLSESKDIPELGLVNVPVGTWIISQDGKPIQCPSDESFKQFYTSVTGTVKPTTSTTQQIPNANTGD